jgi:hypothetical protein
MTKNGSLLKGVIVDSCLQRLTEEAAMVSNPKIFGVITCGFLLSLSLSNVALATERMKPDPCADRKTGMHEPLNCDKDAREGIETIKGEVLRVDGDHYLVQQFDGREVRLQTDANTQMTGIINRGNRIEAKVREVDDQQHVLSIRETK